MTYDGLEVLSHLVTLVLGARRDLKTRVGGTGNGIEPKSSPTVSCVWTIFKDKSDVILYFFYVFVVVFGEQ